MKESVRRYLADIGRRGGIRSRRTLTPEQAQAMVASREAKRAVREFEQSAIGTPTSDLPGVEIVRAGLRDLARREHSIDALLVSMAAPRLQRLGIRVAGGFRTLKTRSSSCSSSSMAEQPTRATTHSCVAW